MDRERGILLPEKLVADSGNPCTSLTALFFSVLLFLIPLPVPMVFPLSEPSFNSEGRVLEATCCYSIPSMLCQQCIHDAAGDQTANPLSVCRNSFALSPCLNRSLVEILSLISSLSDLRYQEV